MPSSVTEEDVLQLREAKYLAYEVSHRLPAQGQAVPAPEPGEFVVFVSHLRRGLGFPTDPFVMVSRLDLVVLDSTTTG